MNNLTLVLIDLNPKMVDAWLRVFGGAPGVEVARGSLLDVDACAWVSPTNARAVMDGGLDAAIRARLGAGIQARVRRAVTAHFGDFMPVGAATCVATGRSTPRYLISTPTMHGSSDDISATANVARACAAALHAASVQARLLPGSVRVVAMPGLGAGTGRVSHHVCAELMWVAWSLLESARFDSFEAVDAALREELGDLGPMSPVSLRPARRASRGPTLPVPYHGRAAA